MDDFVLALEHLSTVYFPFEEGDVVDHYNQETDSYWRCHVLRAEEHQVIDTMGFVSRMLTLIPYSGDPIDSFESDIGDIRFVPAIEELIAEARKTHEKIKELEGDVLSAIRWFPARSTEAERCALLEADTQLKRLLLEIQDRVEDQREHYKVTLGKAEPVVKKYRVIVSEIRKWEVYVETSSIDLSHVAEMACDVLDLGDPVFVEVDADPEHIERLPRSFKIPPHKPTFPPLNGEEEP